jgi:hypothetical protein
MHTFLTVRIYKDIENDVLGEEGPVLVRKTHFA